MYTPLGIKTDYSILKSLIKLDDLISFGCNNNLKSLAILDNNLNASYVFYKKCIKNNIKPIIGLDILIENIKVYLYPVNYKGLQNLYRLTRYKLDNEITIDNLNDYSKDVICVIPYENITYLNRMNEIFTNVFISYKDKFEYNQVNNYQNIIYIDDILSLKKEDSKFVNYLSLIEMNKKLGDIEFKDYSSNVIELNHKDNSYFTDLIDIKFPENKILIPKYDKNLSDSYEYLKNLVYKGLNKRLNNNISDEYIKRVEYELSVIKNMGFVDYFLIVYDYVLFALKNGISVGAGRGSAVGSLVAYCLGITMINPIEYNLLFDRFLNPGRVTLPDIDIDFEDLRRDEVVDYIKNKYGINYTGNIITYGTMASKEVLRIVAKINDVNEIQINNLSKLIDSNKSLKDNYENIKEVLNKNSLLKKVYKEAFVLEGLKRNTSIHAAGVVISSVELSDVVPINKSGNNYIIGFTKDEIEELGLIKMDLLSIKNLTIISNTLNSIKDKYNKSINLNNIDLNDQDVYKVFSNADTVGIFQFESDGIKNFLRRLKPTKFDDLVIANAIYRPGAIDSINDFLDRKNGTKKIEYINDTLKSILESTYGIIIYQEQIMEILKTMGSYTYSEADIVRRAISKKKLDIIENEREKFTNNSIKNGYSKDDAVKVFDLIVKFADFGFNKSHSVAYAFIAYQMAYLKVKFPIIYYINLLNTNIGGDIKIKEYIESAKKNGIKIYKPDINKSSNLYIMEDDGIRLPISCIKGVSNIISNDIINNRGTNYEDFFDFICKTNINKNILNVLIDADIFNSFGYNHSTLKKNITYALNYATLAKEIDSSLVSKPEMIIVEEEESITNEKELYGFYISNHPCSKYPEYFKQIDIEKNFNKRIETYVIVDSIKTIKTKTNKDMSFLSCSDETGSNEYIVFENKLINDVNVGDIVCIKGLIERRFDKYQVVVNDLKKV